MKKQITFLCVSSYFKGEAFITACKAAGNKVYLVTSLKLKDEAWPWDDIEDVFYMQEEDNGVWNMDHLINAVAFKMRNIHFDRFVALDDFDVEKVAALREQFRIPGMGGTTSRYFRDKLAMRVKAKMEGVPVPDFSALFNDEEIEEYLSKVAPPWMIKPRSEASAAGIKKITSVEEFWHHVNELGDERHKYLVEKFAPGQVFHVDALTFNSKVVFSRVSGYVDAPFDVAHGGGIFRSQTLDFKDVSNKALATLNKKVLKAFGMEYSASHTEFIRSHETGEYLFLETSSRVGGANLAEMVEFASGVNLWVEWAKLESAKVRNEEYVAPEDSKGHAGIVVSLSRFEHPDTSQFQDDELVWRMNKPWHIGLIVKAENTGKVTELLGSYATKIGKEYHASAPAPDSAI